MIDKQDFKFTADDLALLTSETVDDDASTDAGSDAAKVEETSKSGQGDAKDQGSKVEDKQASDEDASKARDKRQVGTILDDDDDTPADEEPADKGKQAEDKKPDDKQPEAGKWRESFADKLLEKLKGKIPADKLDERRSSILNRLNRYRTPEDYMMAGFSAQERISSGDLRPKLADNASEEEIAEYRKAAGIPDKAQDYDVPKIPGYKWTDNDKPMIDSFKEYAHKGHYDQKQVDLAAQWYVSQVQQQQGQIADTVANTDREDRENQKMYARDRLGKEEFRPGIERIGRIMEEPDVIHPELAEILKVARYTDPNGVSRRVFNHPGMFDMLDTVSRLWWGAGGTITGDGKPETGGPEDIIKQADEKLRANREEYFREKWDEKAIAAQLEIEARGARRGGIKRAA